MNVSTSMTRKAIEEILRLKRSERVADPALREELRTTRDFLQELVGPTVRRAEAARLLDVSQTALDRWVKRGEIPTVITPHGRREIPLSQFVDLLEEVETARSAGGRSRPLASVIKNRKSSSSIDLDRLLPRPRRRRGHRVAELKSLAYHRLVAERLDDEIIDIAKRRLRRWRQQGRIHSRWAEEWERVLDLPPSRLARTIGADTPRGRELRQSSPFAGVLSEHERRELDRAVENRAMG